MSSQDEENKADITKEQVKDEGGESPPDASKEEKEGPEVQTSASKDANEATETQQGDDSDENSKSKQKRVYVGNLAWEVSWQDLKDLFKTTGHEVTHADIMRTRDGRSKGCGIVEFSTAEGAQQAVLTLNDTELMGRQIFVREDREDRGGGGASKNQTSSQAQSNHKFSPGEQAQSRRVYVGNLSWDVAWPELKDHMRSAGNVVHAEVICEHNGRSKGCGIVEYATEEEAQKSIETLTHTELYGRMIFVREDRENSSNPSANEKGGDSLKGNKDQSHNQNTSVYVWNLDYSTTWFQLKDHMRKAGNVDQATILTNPDGNSIGCGVVTYQQSKEAARAIRELQESELNGRPMKLREDRVRAGSDGNNGRGGRGGGRFRGRGGRGGRGGYRSNNGPAAEGTQLFVTNLSASTTWQKLKDHFKQIGDVERSNVKDRSDGTKFGTVRFYNKEDASKAIDELNGVELDGKELAVRLDHKA